MTIMKAFQWLTITVAVYRIYRNRNEPDFRSIEEVQDFVEKLALRLKYAGVCDAKMEQGSMRVDVNISIMPVGSTEFGTRAELKNLNSLKSNRSCD